MTSESQIELVKPEDINLPSYYVFYNEWNGEIINVMRRLPDDNINAYIETNDITAKKILKGDVNERSYIIAFDNDENLRIIPRDDKLRLRSSEKTLHQLTRTYNSQWDIRVKIYTKNSKLLIEINPDSISKLTKMTFKKELMISKESDLDLYLTKHNKPDFFIEKIEIDPVELLDKGNIHFDISAVDQHINITDLGLLTRRCFKNYHIEFIQDSLNVIQNSLIKNRSYVVERAFKSFPHAHLSLRNTEKGITITPNVSVTDLEDVGLLEKKLKLHFVGKAMDEFYGTIEVDVEQLKKTGTFLMPIQAEFKDLNLLHNKHRLIISIEEENNND
jgi:hypothetical protein